MTITLGDISVRYVNLMLDLAYEHGVNTRSLAEQFRLDSILLAQPEGRISIPKFMRLGQTIIEAAQLPQLGILMGRRVLPSTLGLAGLTASCAENAEQSLQDFVRYESLTTKNARGSSQFLIVGKRILSEFYSISPYNNFNYFIVDLALTTQLTLVQHITGESLQPIRVQIEFPKPNYAEHYEHSFQCPIEFNASKNALVFTRDSLQVKTLQANKVTHSECKALCDIQLAQLSKNLNLQERVMQEISPLLQTQALTIEHVASRLDMPPWTLRRKLNQENVSFKDLLDNTRKALSLIYLRDPQYSLGEIAYLLGFSYPNAFQRAFKRWEGVPPGEYRQTQLNNR